eukprot:TRINITY_DN33562_c0_g1_i1.p1 TRINITY_DN33562_c0_g1~~TRINITY_DN33562_c0_g1_i1.p1  ORF type:complete len:577 (-),score=109.32 TRINITY_DN33562_c0_g1_i1:21-1703(-)
MASLAAESSGIRDNEARLLVRDFLRHTAECIASHLPCQIMEFCRPTLWLWLASSINCFAALGLGAPCTALDPKEVKMLKEQIHKDLDRTSDQLLVGNLWAPAHLQRHRRLAAERLLLALAERRLDVGYCQGLNFVAAVLLQVLQDEHSAFVVLCGLLARLPEDMFSLDPERLAASRELVQDRLWQALRADRPCLAEHLDALGVDLNLFLPRWLTTAFSGVLSVPATVRLWDHILGEGGHGAALRLALALVLRAEKGLLRCSDVPHVLGELRAVTSEITRASQVDEMLLYEMPVKRFERAEERAHAAAAGSGLVTAAFLMVAFVLALMHGLLSICFGHGLGKAVLLGSRRRRPRQRRNRVLKMCLLLALVLPYRQLHPVSPHHKSADADKHESPEPLQDVSLMLHAYKAGMLAPLLLPQTPLQVTDQRPLLQKLSPQPVKAEPDEEPEDGGGGAGDPDNGPFDGAPPGGGAEKVKSESLEPIDLTKSGAQEGLQLHDLLAYSNWIATTAARKKHSLETISAVWQELQRHEASKFDSTEVISDPTARRPQMLPRPPTPPRAI